MKKELVSQKDQILFKMIIDFNEAMFRQSMRSAKFAAEVLIPCSLKFYKNLGELGHQQLLQQMQGLNEMLQSKTAHPSHHHEPSEPIQFEKMFLQKPEDPVGEDDDWRQMVSSEGLYNYYKAFKLRLRNLSSRPMVAAKAKRAAKRPDSGLMSFMGNNLL